VSLRLSLRDGRDVFVIRVEIDVATMNESVHTTMREEVARAVRTIVASKDANEPTRFDAIGAEHVAKALHKSDGRDHPLVDVKSRDIAHLDPETGWNMTPNVGAFSDKPTRPRKLVKHDFLGKTSSGRRPGKRQVVAGSTETPF
jgi:hypothetical protein